MEDSHLQDKKMDDVLLRRLSLIDIWAEDDLLIALVPGFQQDDQCSSENQEQRSVELLDFDNTLKQKEQVPQPSECAEPIRKNNWRNSFSWNIAFFTCEGFLDDEELASLITVEKGEKHVFPEIQEEAHRSADSIWTLESDTRLKSSKACLFKDVRASIQKSSKATNSSEEKGEGGLGMRKTKASCTSQRGNLASQDKMKPKVAPNKPSISMQNPPKLARQVSTSRQIHQMKPKIAPNKPSISSMQNPRKLARQVSASPQIPQMKPKVISNNKPGINNMQNPRKLVRQVSASSEIPQKSSKATNSKEKRREGGSRVRETQASCPLKRGNLASQDKMKTKVVQNKPSIGMQNPQKLVRKIFASPQIPQSLAGSRQSASSLLKRPKVLEQPSSLSTTAAKRASLSVRGAPVSKLPSSSRVPRPALPSKSSSLSSSTATRIESTSSFESSGGISSLKFGISPSISTKKKTNFRTSNIPTSSNSIPKAPSRAVKNKSQPGKSNLSELSASTLPASSISDLCSESLSSISSSQQISSSSRKSFSRSSPHVSASQNHRDDESLVGQESKVSGSVGQCALGASMAMGGVLPVSKPSFLQLPSPKIGFFDGLSTPSLV